MSQIIFDQNLVFVNSKKNIHCSTALMHMHCTENKYMNYFSRFLKKYIKFLFIEKYGIYIVEVVERREYVFRPQDHERF